MVKQTTQRQGIVKYHLEQSGRNGTHESQGIYPKSAGSRNRRPARTAEVRTPPGSR